MFTENPCVSRDEFLEKIDTLIAALEHHQQPAVAPAGPFAQADASSGCHRAH
ncbi:MAG: hypothetical protein BWX79_00595 [Alphaproteobacteria bacterium ADurb.Bin100]|jgi:hypothetical protein|nr:MAG: hypothetical protein BWX79_00595 [Alphaproteobacteria bacterium ADurb.Bin100]